MRVIIVVFSFFLLLLACNQTKVDNSNLPVETKKPEIVDTLLTDLECGEQQGDAMGETIVGQDTIYGSWQTCYYNAPDMDKAYQKVISEFIIKQNPEMYKLISKKLPKSEEEKWFDDKQLGYTYKFNSDKTFSLILQYAGGEDEHTFKLEKNRVVIKSIYSAD